MPIRERIIIKNKAFGIVQERGYYELYRLVRNMEGEILAYCLIGTYRQINEAIKMMVEQAKQ